MDMARDYTVVGGIHHFCAAAPGAAQLERFPGSFPALRSM
jgi:hypothetical protein